jgi:hypothetical protein
MYSQITLKSRISLSTAGFFAVSVAVLIHSPAIGVDRRFVVEAVAWLVALLARSLLTGAVSGFVIHPARFSHPVP